MPSTTPFIGLIGFCSISPVQGIRPTLYFGRALEEGANPDGGWHLGYNVLYPVSMNICLPKTPLEHDRSGQIQQYSKHPVTGELVKVTAKPKPRPAKEPGSSSAAPSVARLMFG